MSHIRLKPSAIILALLGAVLLAGCQEKYYAIEDFHNVRKIDVHVHLNSAKADFINQAKADNFRLLTINVDYPDFPPVAEQMQFAVNFVEENSDVVAFASTFRMDGWDESSWQQQTIEHLDRTFTQGAVAVKVWKNIGMDFHDAAGNNIMIDNSKFDDIFNHISEKDKVLIGHQGEPKNCWLPLEEMTVNNDKGYFKAHPQYHMYLHPELPSYEDQMTARDRMLEKNMAVPFMGAHLASLEWSVGELAKFLDRFPQAVVDMAARMGQIQYQSGRAHGAVREFFIEYQDRLLYASDSTYQPTEDDTTNFGAALHEKWLQDWRYLTSDSTMTVSELNEKFQGLKLPKEVVDKIYRLNAERTFPTAWKSVND